MSLSRCFRALLLVALLVATSSGLARASTHVWVVLGPPSGNLEPGVQFTTDLKMSSWNGAVGTVELVIHYDPAVLHIVSFTTPPDSEFYPNCFADTASFMSGQTRVAGFQVTNWAEQDPPAVLGILTWQVVGGEGAATDVSIEVRAVVDVRWRPMEVLTGGQHIMITRPIRPAAVADLAISRAQVSVKLNWSPIVLDERGEPVTIDHYNIYRSTAAYFVFTPDDLYATSTVAEFMDSGVLNEPGSYYYGVTAVDTGGRESVGSNIVGKFTFTIVPGAE